ncbi:MAG: glycosyltransferase family 25 protein [Wenzhouxiangella sp.]
MRSDKLIWPIFVISLSDCVERRAALGSDLKKAGLQFEVFPAVDARNGVPAQYEIMIDRRGSLLSLGREMSEAEFGCALSHHIVYKRVIDMGLPGAVIFEDDARLLPGAGPALHSRFFEKYDFTQFNYGFARIPRFGISKKQETGNVSTIRLLCNSGLASGYAVSRRACKFICKESLPLVLPADWPCDLRYLKPRITMPKLISSPEEIISQSTLMAARNSSRSKAYCPHDSGIKRLPTTKSKNPTSLLLKVLGWAYAKTLTQKKRTRLFGGLLAQFGSQGKNSQ